MADYTPERKALIRAAVMTGRAVRDISEQFSCSREYVRTVRSQLEAAGIEIPRLRAKPTGGFAANAAAHAQELLAEGVDRQLILRRTGITPLALDRLISRSGKNARRDIEMAKRAALQSSIDKLCRTLTSLTPAEKTECEARVNYWARVQRPWSAVTARYS